MQTAPSPEREAPATTGPGAPPSSPPESVEDAVMGLMMTLGRRIRQRQPGDTIDVSAFPLLKVLSHQGPMRLSSLAQLLCLDASTVSRHVRQLEDRGLLERTDDPDDRRASRVAVSPVGATCLEEGFRARLGLVTAALGGFSEQERETLRGLLERLTDQLQRPTEG